MFVYKMSSSHCLLPGRASLAKDRRASQSRADQGEQAEQPLLSLRRDRDRGCARDRRRHHHADIWWTAVWLRGERMTPDTTSEKGKKHLNLDHTSPSFPWRQLIQPTIISWSQSLKSFREITVSLYTTRDLSACWLVFDVWRMMTGPELMLSMPTSDTCPVPLSQHTHLNAFRSHLMQLCSV